MCDNKPSRFLKFGEEIRTFDDLWECLYPKLTEEDKKQAMRNYDEGARYARQRESEK